MKIQCDVCNKNDASLFCSADEAALCDSCDHRVHHANKLAYKHQRFTLNHPSPEHFPVCDVCKEKRACVFCQQDRAILCKECDLPIHSANEHTKKHTRFLLTGIKLSASATFYSPAPSSNSKFQSCVKKNHGLDSSSHQPLMAKTSSSTVSVLPTINKATEEAVFTSSISEYLINTIPGWQFEDLINSPSLPFGFSKNGNEMVSLNGDIGGNMVSFSPESIGGIWVPQAPSSVYSSSQLDQQIGYRETKEAINRSRLGDDNFIVPQMTPHNGSSKRSRHHL